MSEERVAYDDDIDELALSRTRHPGAGLYYENVLPPDDKAKAEALSWTGSLKPEEEAMFVVGYQTAIKAVRKSMHAHGEPPVSTPRALWYLKLAIEADRDLARSWHANVAMSFVDEGGDHTAANKAAARFMYTAFEADTTWCVTEACGAEAQAAPADPLTLDLSKVKTTSAKAGPNRLNRWEFVITTQDRETAKALLSRM